MIVPVFIWFLAGFGVGFEMGAAHANRRRLRLHRAQRRCSGSRQEPNLQFRFVSTVTILQHAIRRVLAGDEARSTAAVAARARGTKGIRGLLPAKELGKSWRFFPTYVEV
jgi:hypothetical protein